MSAWNSIGEIVSGCSNSRSRSVKRSKLMMAQFVVFMLSQGSELDFGGFFCVAVSVVSPRNVTFWMVVSALMRREVEPKFASIQFSVERKKGHWEAEHPSSLCELRRTSRTPNLRLRHLLRPALREAMEHRTSNVQHRTLKGRGGGRRLNRQGAKAAKEAQRKMEMCGS